MKKISICIPVLNEEANIITAFDKINNLFNNQLKNYEHEIIFTDNHSNDNTEKIITNLCKNYTQVKYIRFKKNLDYDKSILEGYLHASGDAAIVIDCDLQDPPELFVEFIKKWEDGYDLVYGLVNSRKENFLENLMRKTFYKIMNTNAYALYPENAHDFRLIDKSILMKIKNNSNLFPYTRGITFSACNKPFGILYDRTLRKKGISKLGFYNSFTYAVNAFIEETFFFTKILRRTSMAISFVVLVTTIFNIFSQFTYFSIWKNIIIIFMSLLFFTLILILEYVTRNYFQTKEVKINFYEKKINF